MLIVFEGIDGAGKDTQARFVSQSLNALIKSYPDRGGLFGDLFNRVLSGSVELDGEQLFPMFLMDMYKDKSILQRYKSNSSNHMILVRYAYSTIAYQCTQGFDYERGKSIVEKFGIIKPDYVFYLDIDPKEGLERSHRASREIFEKVDFLEKVRELYKKLYEENFFVEHRAYWIETSYPKREISNHILSLLDF